MCLGAWLIYISVIGIYKTGEMVWSSIIIILGLVLCTPVLKVNKVILNAKNKNIVSTRSWFGFVTKKTHIINSQLSLVEVSGFATGEFEKFFDPENPVLEHFSMKFFSYPELTMNIATLSDILKSVAFLEAHFDTDLALVAGNRRHKLSIDGLKTKSTESADIPNDRYLKISNKVELIITAKPVTSPQFCSLLMLIWLFTLFTVWFLFNHADLVGAQYLTAVLQSALSVILIMIGGYLSTLVMGRKKFSVSNGDLIVKATGAKNKVIKLNDVWGAANVARRTYLLTKSGAICLGYNSPRKYSIAIHDWFAKSIDT
ncbi:hypothetical protein PPAR_a2156 [Pseudoalteromonas paragorgicola KMM 3548]|nr:hypothetical protein [Pseudoalteromonas distincta KMM 3548]